MGETKTDPRPIISAHLHTLVDGRDGSLRVADYVLLFGAPALCAVPVFAFDVRIRGGLAVGLLTVAGVVAAFLFQLAVQIVDRSSAWADTGPAPGPRTARQAKLLKELMANASYASLVAIGACVVLVVAAVAKDATLQQILSVASVMLLAHLALTLVMVLRRLFLMAVERLDAARTGTARIERDVLSSPR